MRLSYFLLVLLFFLSSPHTHSQFSTCDIRGTTPTLPCNYCTLSPSITIGANSTLPPTPQTLSVGLYSTNLALGTYSPSTTVATGPTAGDVTVGSPTANPGQDIDIGRGSYAISMGVGTPTFKHSFFQIGQQFQVTSTPTMPDVYASICSWDDFVYMAENARQTYIATGPTAGPVTIGISSPSTSPQNIQFGRYGSGEIQIGRNRETSSNTFINAYTSSNLYLGRVDHSTTNQQIIIGQNNAPPSPTPAPAQQILIGTHASSITVATGSTAGPVTIGSPTSNPGQTVTVASVSSSLLLGQSVSANIQMGNRNIANTVVVGNDQPSAQPSLLQTVTFAKYANSVGLAESANTLTVSNYATAGPVTIGLASLSPTTTQDLNIGDYSNAVLVGRNAKTYIALGEFCPVTYFGRFTSAASSQILFVGENNPSPTPSPGQQCRICELSGVGVTLGSGPTAGPITIGRTVPAAAPSLAGSNRVQLKGLYHYFYSGVCRGHASVTTTTLICDYSYRTNADVNAGVTSGYNTDTDFWYPPEPGHYMVTANAAVETSSYGYLYIVARVGASTATYATARAYGSTDLLSISASVIISFNSVGTDNYIYLQGADLYDTSFSEPYTRFIITRVA